MMNYHTFISNHVPIQYHNLCNLATNSDGEIFGGFVRDMVSNTTPRDIDVYFRTYYNAMLFATRVTRTDVFSWMEKVEESEYGTLADHVARLHTRTIYVDIIVSPAYPGFDDPVVANKGRLDKTGLYLPEYVDWEAKWSPIEKRLLYTPKTMKRIIDLQNRGWTLTTEYWK